MSLPAIEHTIVGVKCRVSRCRCPATNEAELRFTPPPDFIAAAENHATVVLKLELSADDDFESAITRRIVLNVDKIDNGVVDGQVLWIDNETLSASVGADPDGGVLADDDIVCLWYSLDGGTKRLLGTGGKTYKPSRSSDTLRYGCELAYSDGQGYGYVHSDDFGAATLELSLPLADIKGGYADEDGDGLIEIRYLEDLYYMDNNKFGSARADSNNANISTAGCPPDGCFGYELVRDLDFAASSSYRGELGDLAKEWTTDVDGDGRYGWNGLSEFAATLDGNGHTIANMTQKNVLRGGLIYSTTSSLVEIERLGLIDMDIAASTDPSKYVGGLISRPGDAVTVSLSHVSGTINLGGNNSVVGGLIAMTGESEPATEIDRCRADVAITSNGDTVGGLVGILSDNSRIRHSQVHGTVAGNSDRAGALVGLLHGTVENSYATAQVTGRNKIGGLVGEGTTAATIRNSYAHGDVAGADIVGGLVGVMRGYCQR